LLCNSFGRTALTLFVAVSLSWAFAHLPSCSCIVIMESIYPEIEWDHVNQNFLDCFLPICTCWFQ
jgi:hypothetical protein